MTNVVVPVSESSQVAEARRAAVALARAVDADETLAGQIAIVATEAATNVVKHGAGGAVLLSVRDRHGVRGLEILALDRGPGMPNVERCMQDGYSTAGSAGNGLGAIRRLASSFDLYSAPGLGTALCIWVAAERKPPTAAAGPPGVRFESGGVCVAFGTEEVAGDAWIVEPRPWGSRVVVVDGLGHGPQAASAAHSAIELAIRGKDDSVPALLERIHLGLRSTRGAAVAVAEIDARAGAVRFAGLGNVSGLICTPGSPRRQMISYNGTAGHEARKIADFTYPWQPNSVLIMHSDGLGTSWMLDKYPGLERHHPSVIAGVLYRDFARSRDDVSVVVVRQATAEAA